MIGEDLGCPADDVRHQRCLAEARRGGDDQVAFLRVRYTTRAHTLVVSNVRPEHIPEPRLRSRFLDAGLCQAAPNAADDYHQRIVSRR